MNIFIKKTAACLLCSVFLTLCQTGAMAMADTAECACVINGATGEVVFSKNISKKHAMASTTKIMTAIIAIEECAPDEIVTVSANAANTEGSSAELTEGMQIYMHDLLYGLMLNSGNDAAVAIAEHVSESVEAFTDYMNVRARDIGAKNTNFVNPNGLYDDMHYTTAADLAIIARYAMRNPVFRDIVASITYTAQPLNSETPVYYANHNKLFEMYPDVTGIKTGYTEAAGRCLVSSAKRDDMEFIAVTLGDNDDWNTHMEMLDYAFSTHYPKNIVETGDVLKTVQIDGNSYNMVAEQNFTIPFRDNTGTRAELITHLAPSFESPLYAGDRAGYLEIRINGEHADDVGLVTASDIDGASPMRIRAGFYGTFKNLIKRILF